MANQKSEIKSLPEINVGVVGHIDHGKTTLLSKLTGKFTDTHSEELKRGITIKLGYADMTIYKCPNGFGNKDEKGCEPFRYISFIDAPGHEMLMATMLSGAAIIPVSTLQEINIDKIIDALAKIEIPKREINSEPIFLVARSFDINRPGTEIKDMSGGVLGGILKKGKLKVGDEIEIKPGLSTKKGNQYFYKTLKTKILSLHKGNKSLNEVSPGASISIETSLDPFMTKADSLNGCLVSKIGILPEITNKIKIKSKLFDEVLGIAERKKTEPLKSKEMLMLSVNTTITVGTVEKIKNDEAELSLNIPIVALKGDNLGIARNISGHWRLIGFGEIIN